MTTPNPPAGPEMDARVCTEVMGWPIETHDGKPPHFHRTANKSQWTWLEDWSPSTDPAAAYEMEDEIERRGLKQEYTAALSMIVMSRYAQGFMSRWALIRATPAQRSRAALAAAAGERSES